MIDITSITSMMTLPTVDEPVPPPIHRDYIFIQEETIEIGSITVHTMQICITNIDTWKTSPNLDGCTWWKYNSYSLLREMPAPSHKLGAGIQCICGVWKCMHTSVFT